MLAALAFGSAATPALAQAAGGGSSTSASQSALDAILQNDFEIGGQVSASVDASSLPATLNLNVDGLPLQVVVNGQTSVQVGPYAVDPSFLLVGVSAKVWFHVDNNGNAIADLIVIAPTTVKGRLVSDQSVDSQDPAKGQVLTLAVPAQNGSAAQDVTVDVLPATTVKILPPWDASQGLSGTEQVAAVGVMGSDDTLVAAMVVGVVVQH